MSALAGVLATGTINPGEHVTRTVGGLTLDMDMIWTTLIAGAVIVALGLLMRRKATSGVPGKLQLMFETVVAAVTKQIESTIGLSRIGRAIVPLAVTEFLFILTCNWLEVIPSGHHPEYLPAPTGDVNLVYAMTLFVIALVHLASLRVRGFKGYIAHYFKPKAWMFPINLIEEIAKPVTLSLRLFGNIFAGGLMLAVIALLPLQLSPGIVVFDFGWKIFDMFIGVIQAFIFSLLTILYFEAAMSDVH